MRPDRVVVGECRGGEALDMLQAMGTGVEGSMTTVHANTPADAFSRLETMVMMAKLDLPSKFVRQQMASVVHMLVQTARLSDGSRKASNSGSMPSELGVFGSKPSCRSCVTAGASSRLIAVKKSSNDPALATENQIPTMTKLIFFMWSQISL